MASMMRSCMHVVVACLMAALANTAFAQPTVPAHRQATLAWIIPIHGPIDSVSHVSLERRLLAAKSAGADAVVLELDTPGGDLEATLRMLHALRDHGPPVTVAWIRPFAFSAGVILALDTDAIVTTSDARLGDAAPITPLGPLPAAERAKIESPLLAEVVDAARRHGHDERLVRKNGQPRRPD